MKYEFKILDKEQIKIYVSQFREIEKYIEYPLEDGENTFTIDHGLDYHTFFSQQGHKSRFIAIKNNDRVIGTLAVVWKTIQIIDKNYTAIYFSDLKLDFKYRKKRIIHKLFWYLLKNWPLKKDFRGWDFAYYCAMLRDGGSVEKSFSILNPARLASGTAMFNIYMVDPEKIRLLNWEEKSVNKVESFINLSSQRNEFVFWNDGKKDIISKATKTVMPLGHLHPQFFINKYSIAHKNAINEISNKDNALACFAIDNRDKQKIEWLKSNDISTETKCKIFSFSPFSPSLKNSKNLYISTGEI
jgi:hypothetical protein